MSWVENIGPDDGVKVEIIWPSTYVKKSMDSMKQYSSAIAHLCKGAAILGDDETEFLVYGMTILQIYAAESAMRQFGIEMTHDTGIDDNGERWTYFYCDLRGLKRILEENDADEE